MSRFQEKPLSAGRVKASNETQNFTLLKVLVSIPVLSWIGGVIYALATGR